MIELPNPISLMGVLALIALIPFIALMATSFVKIVVVLSLIRNALGVQQVPPNMVLHGIALVLTAYVIAPVISAVAGELSAVDLDTASAEELIQAASHAAEPFRKFLRVHAEQGAIDFFIDTAQEIWPLELRDSANADHLLVLIPAFTLSELKSAFQIGFLIYLPFIAIDLIVSNILLAMGMMMVSPMTISLPFKLLLFVLLDGWTRLVQGLVLTYT